jgi:hypothetical protein
MITSKFVLKEIDNLSSPISEGKIKDLFKKIGSKVKDWTTEITGKPTTSQQEIINKIDPTFDRADTALYLDQGEEGILWYCVIYILLGDGLTAPESEDQHSAVSYWLWNSIYKKVVSDITEFDLKLRTPNYVQIELSIVSDSLKDLKRKAKVVESKLGKIIKNLELPDPKLISSTRDIADTKAQIIHF